LFTAGLINNRDIAVKVLANGDITKSLTVAVDKVSGSARQKIESAGGTVEE
jgi:large subunit ribosomal protein L15